VATDPRDRGVDSDVVLELLKNAGADQAGVSILAGVYEDGRATRALRTNELGHLLVAPINRDSETFPTLETVMDITGATAFPATIAQREVGKVSQLLFDLNIEAASTIGESWLYIQAIQPGSGNLVLVGLGPISALGHILVPLPTWPTEILITMFDNVAWVGLQAEAYLFRRFS
jgi:hypothetical protein